MPKAASNKRSAKSSPPAAKSQSPKPSALGAAEAVELFASEARAIADKNVVVMRADPALAQHNIAVGLAAVLPHADTLAALPAPFDIEKLKSLDHLSLALVHAAAQVDDLSTGETRKLLSRAAELRDVLLTSAIALAKTKLIPEAPVKRIKAGKGSRDFAQDCVDLAKLFRDHAAAIKGKSPVTKQQVDEAAAVGTELLGTLKPTSAKKTRSPKEKEAADLRDRLWTLLQMRHRDQLRRAGHWLWLDQVDDYVPALQSAKRAATKAKTPKSSEA